MGQFSAKNTLLLSSSGVPVATNVVTTDNNILINPKTKTIAYKDVGNGSYGNQKDVVNDDYVVADFKVDVISRSSGAAGVAPKIAELFKVCGLKETINAGADVIYTPSDVLATGTAKAYLDGSMREITGIAGDFNFSGAIGEMPKFSFSLKGFTTLEETVEANPAVSLDTNKLFIVKSITALTVGGTKIDLKSFDFSMGAKIEETYAANIKEYFISDWKPTVKVKAVKTKGNFAHWSELKNNTKKELVIVLGNGAGETFTFTATYCAPVDVSESDDAGKVVYERTWNCESSTGNDNFSIKYS